MPTYYENLKNKTAIITGGASGLGAGIAKILAKQGAVISLVDISSSNLQKTKNEIEELGNKIFTYTCDLTNQNQVKETKRLIEFCNLEWEENCIDYTKNDSGIKTISLSQARSPIYKSSVNLSDYYRKSLKFLDKN